MSRTPEIPALYVASIVVDHEWTCATCHKEVAAGVVHRKDEDCPGPYLPAEEAK